MSDTVVYTANINNYDEFHIPTIIDPTIDYVYYTNDRNLLEASAVATHPWKVIRADMPYSDPTRNARLPKVLCSEYADAEYSVWVDASFTINTDIRKLIDKSLKHGYDMACFDHSMWGTCAYYEATYCGEQKRDDLETLQKQIDFYKRRGFPKNFGMWATGVLIRKHSKKVIRFCDQWMEQINKYSKRDQVSFPYLVWQNEMRVAIIPGLYLENDLFIQAIHKTTPSGIFKEDRV